MNAFTPTESLSAAVVDEKLFTGFQLTDTLVIDLYGSLPDLSAHPDDEQGGYIVSGVTVSGHMADISELFTGSQLDAMGKWLDYKDSPSATLRSVAETKKYEAMRPPYERNRGLN